MNSSIKKRFTIVMFMIIILTLISLWIFSLKLKYDENLRKSLGVRYPVYKNDLCMFRDLLKESQSLNQEPLVFYVITDTRPPRETELTLKVHKKWDKRAYCFIRILIENGADVNLANGSMTPLAYASQWNLEETVKLLLQNGANPNPAADREEAPLLQSFGYSRSFNNTKTIKMLLDYGANPNTQNQYGDTALHEAVKWNTEVLVLKYLLAAGANPLIKNNKGQTALDIEKSRSNPNIEIVTLLETFMTRSD